MDRAVNGVVVSLQGALQLLLFLTLPRGRQYARKASFDILYCAIQHCQGVLVCARGALLVADALLL